MRGYLRVSYREIIIILPLRWSIASLSGGGLERLHLPGQEMWSGNYRSANSKSETKFWFRITFSI